MSRSLRFFIIFLFVFLIFACNSNNQSPTVSEIKGIEIIKNNLVHLKIVFNIDSIDDISLDSLPYWKPGVTVGTVMDSVNGMVSLNFKEHSGMGRLLIGIENITVTDSSFWYLCLNDTASNKGMDNKELRAGSSISWHFGTNSPCFKNQFKL